MSSDRFAPASTLSNPASTSTPGTPDLGTGIEHGLVTLSDYRKRRAEILDAQGREALLLQRPANPNTPGTVIAATTNQVSTPDRSNSGTPTNDGGGDVDKDGAARKKRRVKAIGMLSFANDDDEGEDADGIVLKRAKNDKQQQQQQQKSKGETTAEDDPIAGPETRPATPPPRPARSEPRIIPNASLGVVPKLQTKAALRREALERESLRQEFLAIQAAVKATEIAIPFVFYDGTDLPGGMVRIKKGDPVWLFLDRGRKVGATMAGGTRANARARREWARVSVDDLMLVRGTIIIPPHYEIYFFILNKSTGPGERRLFGYSCDAPFQEAGPPPDKDENGEDEQAAAGILAVKAPPTMSISALEGARDDASFTKIVNRRWYERNKHIYPASLWQEYDPEKDYATEVRRDLGGNTFFFSG